MQIHAETINGKLTLELNDDIVAKIGKWTDNPKEVEAVRDHLEQQLKETLNDLVRYMLATGEQIRGIVEPDDDTTGVYNVAVQGGHITL